jgi:hypothetical protein
MAKITFFATSVDAIASVVIASGNFQGATAQLWFPPFKPNVYTQVLSSYLTAFRSPLTPLEKGGKFLKVPLFKGDLGGSDHLCVHRRQARRGTTFALKFCFEDCKILLVQDVGTPSAAEEGRIYLKLGIIFTLQHDVTKPFKANEQIFHDIKGCF